MPPLVDALIQGLLHQGFARERADAVVHALVDIEESTCKIYSDLVPQLLRSLPMSSDEFREKLWDVREEFRHIAYHLRDAELADL